MLKKTPKQTAAIALDSSSQNKTKTETQDKHSAYKVQIWVGSSLASNCSLPDFQRMGSKDGGEGRADNMYWRETQTARPLFSSS